MLSQAARAKQALPSRCHWCLSRVSFLQDTISGKAKDPTRAEGLIHGVTHC
jgi:hypothetical protein